MHELILRSKIALIYTINIIFYTCFHFLTKLLLNNKYTVLNVQNKRNGHGRIDDMDVSYFTYVTKLMGTEHMLQHAERCSMLDSLKYKFKILDFRSENSDTAQKTVPHWLICITYHQPFLRHLDESPRITV